MPADRIDNTILGNGGRNKPQMGQFAYLYNTPQWHAIRQTQLRSHPLCARCMREGRITTATVAHHIMPHRGDRYSFFNDPLESLCDLCHNSTEQMIERNGYDITIGKDGWPIDPKHPANKKHLFVKKKENQNRGGVRKILSQKR